MKTLFKNVFPLVALLALASCNRGISDRKVELANADDSISFAVAMLVSEEMPVAMRELGITDETIDDFVAGLCNAFPADGSPEAVAYAQGVLMAASAMEMLDKADMAIYPDDTAKSVNRRKFLEGLVATAYGTGKTMTTKEAIGYYNKRVFRSVSEEFINRNRNRAGVVTLPSGLQYKIENEGTGPVAKFSDTVKCIYKGTYPNGALFDTTRGEAVEVVIKDAVDGLAEALVTLPVGTKCKLYIPWELGYGAKGTRSIPPYSALVYDMEIVSLCK